ncbi:MAG TPA: STAS domain-containing protein [bacterium]|nr:STAS domain-containing protein [bacterium]
MLTYTIEKRGGAMLITTEGRIDNEGAAIFQEALDRAFEANLPRISFDLAKLSFINSAGIGKLLLFYKRVKNRNGTVVITALNDDVNALFKAIRLDKLMPIERS